MKISKPESLKEQIAGLTPAQRALLEQRLRGRARLRPENHRISPALERDVAPLSFGQQRIWFLEELAPGNTFYSISRAYSFRGVLDRDALRGALAAVVRRHEVLRTTFVVSDEQPVQRIVPDQDVELPVFDVEALAGPDREQKIKNWIASERRRPFDLSTGPLLRAALLCTGEQEHILLLTMHHIVSDGWSIGILITELAEFYRALSRGTVASLPDLPIQYADFARWQRKWLSGEVLEEQLSYWKQQLTGLPVLELPTDSPRPAVQSFRGARESISFSSDLVAGLKELSQREGATLYMTLLAGFAALLGRYAGQQDVMVGSPIAGRNRAEIEGLIGFFVNTLVLRTDLSGDPSFRELVGRVREVALEAYAHQDLPFEKLVEELRPERTLGQNPLFQTTLTLQNAPAVKLDLPGASLTPIGVETVATHFDLEVYLTEQPNGLTCAFVYATDLFDSGTIVRMLGHYQTLLEDAVASPERRVSELEILTQAERRQLLEQWNQTEREYPREKTLCELFEEQAAKAPEATAVVFGEGRLTYGQLNRRSNQLARYLSQRGVGPEVLVGVCVERSLEMVVGLLGILKAGGAYVPLDPTYPRQRVAFMLEDAKAPLLLTQQSLLSILPEGGFEPVCLDADWPAVALESDGDLPGKATPESLAYVIYTSGSTGTPKGVAIEHHSAVALVSWMKEAFSREELDGVLASTSICFDLSVFELLGTLGCGGKVVLAMNALDVARAASSEQVRLVNTVPSAIAELLRVGELPASVVAVNLAGEPLATSLVVEILRRSCVRRVLDLYGPSEDTTYSTCARRLPEGPTTIGRPISNKRSYILDSRRQPVPIGVAGDLYVAGAGVARGYLNRPELTADRFLDDPFRPGQRMYATGDRARFLPDGNIQFLGRLDQQVKVRGYRIEIGEVEEAMSRHPGILACAVSVRDEGPEKRLVGYLVAHSAAQPSLTELRAFLKESLPDYMIPSQFLFLASLPLTPNGKIDRRALPAPEAYRPDLEDTFVAPRNTIEEVLAAIWAHLLSVDRVGVEDDFFALGGHSLLATQVISRIRSTFGVELPLSSLFETPTVAGLARAIGSRKQAARDAALPLVRAPLSADFPLSFAQQRLWFLEQLEPGKAFYTISRALRLSGNVDIAALESAFRNILQRHESLGSRFTSVEGRPVQNAEPDRGFEIAMTDLTALPEPEREKEAVRRAEEQIARPFDLERGPLLTVSLIRMAEKDHVLVMAMHHIVSDGWSMGILVRELAAYYEEFSGGRRAQLAELAIQYGDFARWQREWLSGEVLEDQLSYWKQQLAGLPVLELPTDRPRPPVQSFRGGRVSVSFSRELTEGLRGLSRRQGATLYMTLLAGFGALLGRYTGQQDLVVGSPIAGRNRAEIEELIGFFVNTLVLRTDLSGNPSFRELLGRVREMALEAYAHQDLPFEKLVGELQPERTLGQNPLFQVLFAHQNAPRGPFELAGLEAAPLPLETRSTRFDLEVYLWEKEDGLNCSFIYATDLFDAETIERMIGHYQRALEGIVADPDRRIEELSLLSETERRKILGEWNQTAAEYPRDMTVHGLFEKQAVRTPDAVAVVFGRESLTYRELNERANRLARYLSKLGVEPEAPVAVCVERSLEMLIGLLAILKAGGAYVPLDPGYPRQRVAFMLEDSDARVVLTQQSLLGGLPEGGFARVCLDTDWPAIAGQSAENSSGAAGPGNLAYVMYTSGSTGTPKGVEIEHHSTVALLAWARERFDNGELDGVLASTSICFDLSVFEIFAPLAWGGKVILSRDALQLPELPAASEVKLVNTVPSAMAELLRIGGLPGSVSTINLAGEPLTASLVAEILETGQNRRVFDLYGPTEDTTYSTCAQRTAEGPVTIGRPISNKRVYLLDGRLQPVAIGVSGDLYVAGAGVARGYRKRPEMTAEKFLADPFRQGGERMYRTGDRGRFLSDGQIQFLGRTDHQVKIRGYRIEIGEIEQALTRHPEILACAVAAREEKPGDKRLVGYVVSRSGSSPSVTQLRGYLKSTLPDYMVPSTFVFLDALPLTPNGKLDRRALPAPEQTRPELEDVFVAPRNAVEQTVARIWSQVLGLEKVGVHDNFFELGGHSLLATLVFARLQKAFPVAPPLRALFEKPTVAELSGTIEELGLGRAGSPRSPILPVSRQALSREPGFVSEGGNLSDKP